MYSSTEKLPLNVPLCRSFYQIKLTWLDSDSGSGQWNGLNTKWEENLKQVPRQIRQNTSYKMITFLKNIFKHQMLQIFQTNKLSDFFSESRTIGTNFDCKQQKFSRQLEQSFPN